MEISLNTYGPGFSAKNRRIETGKKDGRNQLTTWISPSALEYLE